MIWNIAGLRNKLGVGELWKYVGEFEFIALLETWIEEKDSNQVLSRLPKTHVWNLIPACRDHTEGRAKGGIMTGLKIGIQGSFTKMNDQTM